VLLDQPYPTLNRIEAISRRCATSPWTAPNHASYHEQASMIRRYIAWRSRNAHDRRFHEIVDRGKVA
jgi:hypothetical protein